MKNVSISDKRDDSDVRVEMLLWMNEADFQNEVYSCCGLVLICKFKIQHLWCCGTEKDKLIINASVRECSQCDVFFGGVVAYTHHMEKVHLTAPCVCTLCRNLYISSVVLHCHLVNCHTGLELAKRDYGRKHKLHT